MPATESEQHIANNLKAPPFFMHWMIANRNKNSQIKKQKYATKLLCLGHKGSMDDVKMTELCAFRSIWFKDVILNDPIGKPNICCTTLNKDIRNASNKTVK